MTNRPKISYLATGGTIASVPQGSQPGATPTLTADDLIKATPQIHDVASVETVQLSQLPSPSFTFSTIDEVLNEARRRVDNGAVGVVVSQGTDTIEETAYLLDLVWDRAAPVVITGAMRNPALPGSDGPANLLASVQLASSAQAQGLGVLVVLNEEIHAARFVHKSHTFAASTFTSPAAGPIGWVAEGVPIIRLLPPAIPPISASLGNLPPVALVRCALGDDGRVLPELPRLGFTGAVIEGFGGGHVSAAMLPAVRDLARLMPLVLSSRTGAGETLTKTYRFPGSEIELLNAGLVPAGSLDGLKSRLLLAVLLSINATETQIATSFRRHGAPLLPTSPV